MVRPTSILFITTILLTTLLSGCVEDASITEIAEDSKTNSTITTNITPLVTPPQEVVSTGILVKLDGIIGFIPTIQTIKTGDEVIWENFDPASIILVSNDGFFDAKLLAFYQQFRYVFSRSGTYTFSIKNTNLIGTIIVESEEIMESKKIMESPVIQDPVPTLTKQLELPSTALYVTVRMKKPIDWSSGSEIKYELDALKAKIMNQIDIPLTIKAQILSGDQILEEKTFILEKQNSVNEFSNEKNHFINDTNINLRLFVNSYQPVDYKFVVVDQLN
ncbi:MAG: hypothetical protein OIN87_10875 [Candidatus Methanoperedens sp.]|nr:hypothetical protein [Candidatus Methanoperedens sp.]